MKNKNYALIAKFLAFVFCLSLININTQLNAQTKLKMKKKELRNTWSLGLSYGENGFGPFVSLYAPLGKTTDLNINLSVSGVTDSREVDRYDIYGNAVVPDKVNRVFMIPLNIGIRKELFRNEIEGNFTPIINFGISPTLVLTDPYDKSFFSAFGDTKAHFAAGGYAGIGVSFKQSKSVSMNIAFNYLFLPIIGGGVQSVKYNTINNVGGLQLTFGVIFLK